MVSTINVSNYELLVKPIITDSEAPNRTVIQGYFLTISNPSLSNLQVQLIFKGRTPDIGSSSTLIAAFWDVDNTLGTLTALVPDPSSFQCLRSYTFNIPALDTGLFLLQPNIFEDNVISDKNIEFRGYVRLRLISASSNGPVTLLLSAQQRGTFLPQGELDPPATGDYDQLAYSLPLASGGSEVILTPEKVGSASALSLPSRERIFKAIEANPSVLNNLTNDPLVQQLANLSVEEQKRMVSIFLERNQSGKS
ncbi:hypothetical protein COO91_09115 (plasmid) [Nostoc flagelliforme CCNUN1]|uniref:Uncharacterized protein n=1 Tax=Nostoc flagelliforme CCNUN1 TaxID=2038116 RepID=A0A2K8T5M1_9NOSO|nr:hypothetical protein [Nostoc flagelliforme]AUB42961.1 hypothetical protein COO91_09115 [Nostoc flagelliforme CCNUN1]